MPSKGRTAFAGWQWGKLWVAVAALLCCVTEEAVQTAEAQAQPMHGDYVCTEMLKASMQSMFVDQGMARVAEDMGDLCDLCCKVTRKAFLYRNDPSTSSSWFPAVQSKACTFTDLGRQGDCKLLTKAILQSQEAFFQSQAAEMPEQERNSTESLVKATTQRARLLCQHMSCCWDSGAATDTPSRGHAGKTAKPPKSKSKSKSQTKTKTTSTKTNPNALIQPGACGNSTKKGNSSSSCSPPNGSIEQLASGMSPAEAAGLSAEERLARIQLDQLNVRKDVKLLSHMKDAMEKAKNDLSIRAKAVIVREKELDHAFNTGVIHCNAAQYAQMAAEYQRNATIKSEKLRKEKEEQHKKWCSDHPKDIKCMSPKDRNKTMTGNNTRHTVVTPSGKVVEDEKEELPEGEEAKKERENAEKAVAEASKPKPSEPTPTPVKGSDSTGSTSSNTAAAASPSAAASPPAAASPSASSQQPPSSTSPAPPAAAQQTPTQAQPAEAQPKFTEVPTPRTYVPTQASDAQLAPPLPPGWKWQYKYVYE